MKLCATGRRYRRMQVFLFIMKNSGIIFIAIQNLKNLPSFSFEFLEHIKIIYYKEVYEFYLMHLKMNYYNIK
jgi:hypothetical protein